MPQLVLFILDAELGQPAQGMDVSLYMVANSSETQLINQASSGQDGCIRIELSAPIGAERNCYRAVYRTERYFRRRERNTFYPQIEVDFCLGSSGGLVLPLLISPFAYTVYRGS
jgi:5-hydroxyisourate hydrolase